MLGALIISMATLNPVIEVAARKHSVEVALIKAVIKAESNWDVNASRYEKHKTDASWGLMQLMLETARWILKEDKLSITELIKPTKNISAGTIYLKYQLDRYEGNMHDAIAAYNAGSVRRKKDGTYINQKYVDKVYNYYKQYQQNPYEEPATISGFPIMMFALLAAGGVALIVTRKSA